MGVRREVGGRIKKKNNTYVQLRAFDSSCFLFSVVFRVSNPRIFAYLCDHGFEKSD